MPAMQGVPFSGTVYGSRNELSPMVVDIFDGVPIVGYGDVRPLPTNDYKPSDFYEDYSGEEYKPALDSDLFEGVRTGLQKYTAQKTLCSDSLMLLSLRYLESQFRFVFAGVQHISMEEAYDRLVLTKSPGFPYYYNCVDKEQALEKYDVKYIVESELVSGNQETIYSTTLKSEMRQEGKYPRLFTPAPLHSTVVGNYLYGAQNDAISRTRRMHPIKLGVQMPGHEFNSLFFSFPSGYIKAHFDVKGFDVSICLSIMAIIMEFRGRYINQQYLKAHRAHYSKIYCGYVYVLGLIVLLLGQRSGSTNTFTDNSLYMCCLIHVAFSILCDVSIEQAIDELYFINGSDDGMFAVHPKWGSKFNIVTLANFLYENFGCVLESPSLVPVSFEDCYFFSHHLIRVALPRLGIPGCWIAAGNREKILCGFRYVKKLNMLQNFQRYGALLIVLFPYQADFEYWREKVLALAAKVDYQDKEFRKLISLISSDLFFLKIYTGVQTLGADYSFLVSFLSKSVSS